MTPEMSHISENRDFTDFGPGIDLLAPRVPFRKPNAHPGPARRFQVTRRAALASRRVILFMAPGAKACAHSAKLFLRLAHLFEDFSGSMCSFGTKIGGDTAGSRLEVS